MRILKTLYFMAPEWLREWMKVIYMIASDVRHKFALSSGALGFAGGALKRAVGWPAPSAMDFAERMIADDNATCTTGSTCEKQKAHKVVHYIGQLGSGGAERQLYYLSAKFRRMGIEVVTITAGSLDGPAGHYRKLLGKKGVPTRTAPSRTRDNILAKAGDPGEMEKKLRLVPPYMARHVYGLVDELIVIKPDVLHCWLDDSNIIGGLAGVIAEVPKIVLSVHSMPPTHFTHIHTPWQRKWYRVLSKSSRVTLTSNSESGGREYEQWLGIEDNAFRLVYNGLDLKRVRPGKDTAADDFRKEHDIDENAPLVGGVFRIAPEKRVFDFLEVVKRTRTKVPGVRAVVSGRGPLQGKFEQAISEMGLGGVVVYPGYVEDAYALMSASGVVMLLSEIEGLPLTIIEAQYLGAPVVATRVGGVPEVIKDGVSGVLADVGDIETMSNAVARILTNADYSTGLKREGRKSAEQFSIDNMAQIVLDIYETRR